MIFASDWIDDNWVTWQGLLFRLSVHCIRRSIPYGLGTSGGYTAIRANCIATYPQAHSILPKILKVMNQMMFYKDEIAESPSTS